MAQRTSYNDKAMVMIGQVISHYKILEKLGEGGMSENYPRSRQRRESGCNFQDPAAGGRCVQ